ncbi:MAG: thioredoxin-dependent thiol peroxidase [Reichenbachiella sp.]|uniref:thioredoxin-dependent thiol peroxidase n=1 Tax=Reichenbachiella sp. TaxID=2184521 RepID=UPI002966E131|nr:thioredoxin-dependent thiol peroxidase [Reichenbachiella sp.]MDW3210485.1 thioredoxin-dependent thiol peroxidase [Reichenbachiella sp.]
MSVQVGDKAPEFEAKIQNGSSIKLSDYLGRKVVLYFYPKDNTPGCTAQSCNLRDNYELLQKQGYVVLGVSQDSEKSHVKFKDKFELPFDLISDPDHAVHNLYGTWALKKLYGREYMGTVRTTFVIDEKGVIEEVISKVKTKIHTEQILK